MSIVKQPPNEKVFCACGCGELRDKYDKYGYIRSYIFGHYNNGKKFSIKHRKNLSLAWDYDKHITNTMKEKAKTRWIGKRNPGWKGEIKKKFCLVCGKELTRRQILQKAKYCNRACWVKDSNKITKFCSYCGKKIEKYPSRFKNNKHYFCNPKCQKKHRIGKNSPNWVDGRSFEPYNAKFNKKLKKQIKERDNWTCQKCGFIDYKKDGRLHVHHIDYDKQNSDPRSLITLCNHCHSKTKTKKRDSRNYWTEYFQNKLIERGVIK